MFLWESKTLSYFLIVLVTHFMGPRNLQEGFPLVKIGIFGQNGQFWPKITSSSNLSIKNGLKGSISLKI